MIQDREVILQQNGFEIVGRVRGRASLCWVIGTKRGTRDYGDKELRVFIALAEVGARLIEARFKFSVSRSALATEWIKRLTGNKEEFLLRAGLVRFCRLLRESDANVEEFPEVLLTTRSQAEEFFMDDPEVLDREIQRVRGDVLTLLQRNAYKGVGRTSKEQLVEAVCTDTSILDQSLRYLEGRKLIEGTLSGQIRITPDGEAALERHEQNRKSVDVVSSSFAQVVERGAAGEHTSEYSDHCSKALELLQRPARRRHELWRLHRAAHILAVPQDGGRTLETPVQPDEPDSCRIRVADADRTRRR